MTQGQTHIEREATPKEETVERAVSPLSPTQPSTTSLQSAEKREQSAEAEFLHQLLETNVDTARDLIEVYEAASELVDKIDTLLVRHALKSGFDRESAFALFGDKRFSEAYSEVKSEAEKLTATYFLNSPSTTKEEKYAAVTTTVTEFIGLMRQAQHEGGVPRELLAKDAFKLIAQNITAVALQDKCCEFTTVIDLDAYHLTEHDIRGCMQLADTLSDHGCSLSALEKLLLHQSMVYHCVGYVAPPVLDAIADKGMDGKQLGIPMLGAHYIRSQYEDASSAWKSVFSEGAFDLLHRAILYQDRGCQGSPDMALQVSPTQDETTRAHNLEAIIRIAQRAPESDKD